ncbi:restriction endonuclease subunit S [Stenotrophomonas ginsengisoli]|uniref:restriction endonuclease subunit S n=1 Tax=Stenotrophomonas ginsengisoli TaxID=336566 RepID=UPI00070B99BF|nr:restriction endonuclease subunit S [Stenotrophomonas ginsengisoli]
MAEIAGDALTHDKANWRYVPLKEVAEIGAGNSAPQKKYLFEGGTYPFIRTSDVGQVRFGAIDGARDLLNNEGISGLRLVPAGTILMPKSGASTFLNHRVMMAGEGYVSSHLATITARQNIADPRYLLYCLSTIKAQELIQDNKYPSLTLSVIGDISIPMPPLDEQKRIVAILDQAFAALDRTHILIEQNRCAVDEIFDSVLANVDGEQSLLGDLVTIRTGKLDANAAVEGGEYPFFTCAKDVYAIDRFAFDCEAILLAGNNAVGDFNVKHYRGKFNAYQRTYVIAINDTNRLLYRYLYFQMIKKLKHFKENSVGVGTKFLKLGMINGLKVSVPNVAQQQRIVTMLDTLLEKNRHLKMLYTRNLADLDDLKQSLLQKAFSGQLT